MDALNHINPVWIIPAILAPGLLMAARSLWRERHRLPAAPDNQAGIDAQALWTCRRIAREPLADPNATRRLLNDIRKED
jgi:hypothetical protein